MEIIINKKSVMRNSGHNLENRTPGYVVTVQSGKNYRAYLCSAHSVGRIEAVMASRGIWAMAAQSYICIIFSFLRGAK